MQYFLRTIEGKWEKVTQYVFNHKKHVLNDKQSGPRYSEVSLVTDGNSIDIQGEIPTAELGHICRFLNITVPTGSFPGGLYIEPPIVHIQRGNSKIIHVVGTGENYHKKAA